MYIQASDVSLPYLNKIIALNVIWLKYFKLIKKIISK